MSKQGRTKEKKTERAATYATTKTARSTTVHVVGVGRKTKAVDEALWNDVRQALIERPSHTIEEVAELLNTNNAFKKKHSPITGEEIRGMMGLFESKKETWAVRDRALAKKLNTLACKMKDVPNFRELARFIAPELPHVANHLITKVRKRHLDILGWLEPRAFKKPMPPQARARLEELGLAHPSLDYAQLAQVLGQDDLLGPLYPEWTEEVVASLREPSRLVPSERRRRDALAEIAAAHFEQVPEGTTLDEAIASLAQPHPGVNQDVIMDLTPRNDRLARAVRRIQDHAEEVGPLARLADATQIGFEIAKKIGFTKLQMQRSLTGKVDGLVDRFFERLVDLEENVGNNDKRLSERDMVGAPPDLKKVINRVWSLTGRRTLALEQIHERLPRAIAEVAVASRTSKQPELSGVFVDASRETLEDLASGYCVDVLFGNMSPTAYHGRRQLTSAFWQHLKKTVPDAIPERTVVRLQGKRLEAVSRLYADMVEGKISSLVFYTRSRITKDQLRVLQATHPKKFPRPEGTPFYWGVAGTKNVPLAEATVEQVAELWRGEVLSGEVSEQAFCRRHNLENSALRRMKGKHGDLFPERASLPNENRTEQNKAIAEAFGLRASTLWESDVLMKVPDLIDALNEEEDLVEKYGKLTVSRWDRYRGVAGDSFPDLSDIDYMLEKLADEIVELKRENPDLVKPVDVTAAMRRRHPNFKHARFWQIAKVRDDILEPAKEKVELTAEEKEEDAAELAAMMLEDPERSIVDIAKEMDGARDYKVSRDYLYRLRKQFKETHFNDVRLVRTTPDWIRSSRVASELYALAARLSPPGAHEAQLVKVLDRLLEERGIPPYGGKRVPSNILKRAHMHIGTRHEQNARIVAEMVAEYARAAEDGENEEQIFDRILEDYPTLDKFKLSTYRRMWEESPNHYPSLSGFRSKRRKQGRVFEIGGPPICRMKPVVEPRFIGGWNVESALLKPAEKDKVLAAELADASQYARISLRLPLLDQMVADLNGKKPLRHKNVLWVTHLLGTSPPLAHALRAAGALMTDTMIVGTPYGTNDAVKQTLEDEGFDVRKAKLDPIAYRKEVERAIDDMVKRHRKNHQPIVVMDDGGLVSEILHAHPRKYKDVIGAFKIVEQTTRGITAAEELDLNLPVINVALSKSKNVEGVLIGRSVAEKVLQGLTRLGHDLKDKRVTVMGYGTVGRALARALRKAGAIVTVCESNPTRAKAAARLFDVATKKEAFPTSEVVIGATGTNSVTLEDMKLLPTGAVLASGSSKQLEIDMEGLMREAKSREEIEVDSPLVKLPTAKYRLGRRELTVLGDGWPVNFDGDVEDLPPEEIQLTRCVMFGGALQAATLKPQYAKAKGIVPLDEDMDNTLLKRYLADKKRRKGQKQKPISDPDRWPTFIRKLAKTIKQI